MNCNTLSYDILRLCQCMDPHSWDFMLLFQRGLLAVASLLLYSSSLEQSAPDSVQEVQKYFVYKGLVAYD